MNNFYVHFPLYTENSRLNPSWQTERRLLHLTEMKSWLQPWLWQISYGFLTSLKMPDIPVQDDIVCVVTLTEKPVHTNLTEINLNLPDDAPLWKKQYCLLHAGNFYSFLKNKRLLSSVVPYVSMYVSILAELWELINFKLNIWLRMDKWLSYV